MISNKIKYILVIFIVLSLTMNAFSAIDINNDSDIAEPSDSVDVISDDNAGGDNSGGDNAGGDNQAGDNSGGENQGNGKGTTPTFNFNTTGGSFGGNGSSSFNISDILSKFLSMMGDNSTDAQENQTNQTTPTTTTAVSDVPKVVTRTNYEPVTYSTVEKISQHIIKRARDNKVISEGDTFRLEGINKLFDSDFTNGHLLVYVDGKLVFNEITAQDLTTPVLSVTDDLVGQHEVSVEFTSNADSNSNTNKYTEKIIVE